MTTAASLRAYAFDRQQSLLQLDCSADLRHYSRNLGPGVQERIFQTTSDALRTQLDEHRDFLLQHQRQQQQPHLAPVPVPSGPAPAPALAHRPAFTQPPPLPPPQQQQLQKPPLTSAMGPAIVARSPTKTVSGDINTYPLALREALYSQKSTSRAQDGRTIYHIVCSRATGRAGDDTVVMGSCRSMVAANEVAAQYFLENCLGNSEDVKYKQLANGALSCEAVMDNRRVSVHVQEARLE